MKEFKFIGIWVLNRKYVKKKIGEAYVTGRGNIITKIISKSIKKKKKKKRAYTEK